MAMANFYPVPIFVDFEGVLRPAFSRVGGFPCAKALLEPLFEAIELGLSPCLIIASTYRLERHWRELAAIINHDAPGLGQFFAGATPHGPSVARLPDELMRFANAPRLFEAHKWLEPREAPFAWISIDDSPDLFAGPGADLPDQLLLCESERGFGSAEAAQLSERLRDIASRIELGCAPIPELSERSTGRLCS
jgi:hypothetical protein